MSSPPHRSIQELYPDDHARCYGCGRQPRRTPSRERLGGDEVVARFTPRPEQISMPGFVYGGLIAALVDCHAMATAAAHADRLAGHAVGDGPMPRYVTAALHVDYLRPTPPGRALVRGRVKETGRRKIVVAVTVSAEGTRPRAAKSSPCRFPRRWSATATGPVPGHVDGTRYRDTIKGHDESGAAGALLA